MFIDTHCHILNEYYDDISEILRNSSENNIKYIINNGTNIKNDQEIIKLIEKYDNMYGAIGIHPEEVKKYQKKDLLFIEKNINNPKIVALGEIGLDYHYGQENKEQQIKLFEEQLKIAEKNKIPVIIHNRDATTDIIKVLKKYKVKGTIHSFAGSYKEAQTFIKMGYLLGINGIITFKNSKLKDVIVKINLDNIILETDSPYLSPEPKRGRINTPANIKYIATFVSNLYKITLNDLSSITNNNIKNLYKKIKNG